MATITIPKKQYRNILDRQLLIEKEMAFLKKNILAFDEANIRSSVLSRWEHISRKLDRGEGRSFSSLKEMRGWLKSL
ncbi:hypothetical protein HY504_01065 [Candidatus Wolfebacteria bacterium]|nr:hypothetical protein [Candidatus Wolfebacteria bacterium]